MDVGLLLLHIEDEAGEAAAQDVQAGGSAVGPPPPERVVPPPGQASVRVRLPDEVLALKARRLLLLAVDLGWSGEWLVGCGCSC